MKLLLGAVLLFAIGCDKAEERGAEAAPTPKAPAQKAPATGKDSKMAKELTWAMAKQGDKLHVTYHFENHTAGVVYVNDGLVVQTGNTTFVKVTTNVDPSKLDDTTALITVGTPGGDVPAAAGPMGIYVAVAKGGSFDGARDVLFPFQRRDAMGRVVMLGDRFKQARLALWVSDGEPAGWREIQTDKGKVKIPDGPNIRIIQTDPQPLP